jgi:putative CocE/NonD family hydrolase
MKRLAPLLVALVWSSLARAQGAADADLVRATYTKYEHRIPMRDGVKLFTAVYVPKDRSQRYPIMLVRTPYGVAPYGIDAYRSSLGPSDHFTKEKFIFAYQDVRGRYLSEGTFVEMRPHKDVKREPGDIDESSDTYDTVDWLVRNLPANNGRVGLWGISYPGFYAAAALPGGHPALKAVSPQAPIGDLYMGDDSYHNGAFLLPHNFGFYTFFGERKGDPSPPRARPGFDYETPDGYRFFLDAGPLANLNRYLPDNIYWRANLDHTTYDEFWKSRALLPHLRSVTAAVMTVGGWFDAEDLSGSLGVYRSIERLNPRASNMLVMGPWPHGGWSRGDGDRLGNVSFASKTAAFYREHIELPFFLQHLKDGSGKKSGDKLAEAYVFHTGINEWRQHDAWPPRAGAARELYLGARGGLEWRTPAAAGFDEYLSDPARPVPLVGYTAQGMPGDYMTEDQRHAAQRPDVLVYQSEPLDTDVNLAGPVGVTLYVTSTGTDADFVVKLCDVYPGQFPTPAPPGGEGRPPPPPNAVKLGGYQQLVRGEPFRAKFRDSFEKPAPLEPGKPARITFTMPDIAHTFRRGHRIMVQVHSSWFPYIDRNPQKFVDIPHARPEDFQKATQRVLRGGAQPSHLTVWMLPERI